MKNVYRSLAYLICALVAVQAASHAWASAGLGHWINGGGVLDKAVFEGIVSGGSPPFPEVVGMLVHGMNGMFGVPAVALLLVVVGFVARIRGAVTRSLLVLGLVVLQVALGIGGHGSPLLGLLHGLNALALFAAAWTAARSPLADRAGRSRLDRTESLSSV